MATKRYYDPITGEPIEPTPAPKAKVYYDPNSGEPFAGAQASASSSRPPVQVDAEAASKNLAVSYPQSAKTYYDPVSGEPVKTNLLAQMGVTGEEVKRRAAAGEETVQEGLRPGSHMEGGATTVIDFVTGLGRGVANLAGLAVDVGRTQIGGGYGPGGTFDPNLSPMYATDKSTELVNRASEAVKGAVGLEGVATGPVGPIADFAGEMAAPPWGVKRAASAGMGRLSEVINVAVDSSRVAPKEAAAILEQIVQRGGIGADELAERFGMSAAEIERTSVFLREQPFVHEAMPGKFTLRPDKLDDAVQAAGRAAPAPSAAPAAAATRVAREVPEGLEPKWESAGVEAARERPKVASSVVEAARADTPEDAQRAIAAIRAEQQAAPPPAQSAPGVEAGRPFETAPTTFSARGLKETFGLTDDQAIATEAIADAMGIDKSRIALVKGGTPSQSALAQMGEAGWYYDNVAQSLDSWQPKGTPDQLLAHLKKSKGSMEEAEAIGLTEWLKGKSSVTREEVAKFVGENKIEVSEVTKGEPSWKMVPSKDAAGEFDVVDGSGRVRYTGGQSDAKAYIASDSPTANGTKYGDYQTPGDVGNSYRELLLTLPTKKAEARIVRASDGKFEVVRADGTKVTAPDGSRAYWSARDSAESARLYHTDVAVGAFKSGHFDEPNVLAHVRMNDRTLPDGRKVLFVEEIQSDWHQKGRREGYAGPDTDAGLKFEVYPASSGDARGTIATYNTRAEAVARVRSEPGLTYQALNGDGTPATISNQSGRVPDAPFKGEGWKKLSMKRVLAYASENGYDGVGWTTGEMQNARYSLSRQVESISWRAQENGARQIAIWPKGEGSIEFMVAVDGRVQRSLNNAYQFEGKRLDEVVGKDMADRLMAAEAHSGNFEGEGLDLGGSGMKGFYDRELPNIANDIAKKFGSKVEQLDLKTGIKSDATKPWEVFGDDGVPVQHFATEVEAQRFSESNSGTDYARAGDGWDARGGTQVHFLPTPEPLRAAIKANKLPLFQSEAGAGAAKGAVEFTEGGQAIIRALESPDVSTAVHELSHVSRRFLFDRNLPVEQRFGISDADIKVAEDWSGAVDGAWGREAEEKFARGFESYLRDGQAPTPLLAQVFEKFKAWLTQIYARVTGSSIDVKVSDEMRGVFDNLVQRGRQLPETPGGLGAGAPSSGVEGSVPPDMGPPVDMGSPPPGIRPPDAPPPGAAPPPPPNGGDPVEKILVALREAKPIRKAQEALYTQTRRQRMGDALAARQTGTLGEAGYKEELKALAGEMDRVEYESLRSKIGQEDIDELFRIATDAPDLKFFETVTVRRGLSNMLGGKVPTEGELTLMRKVYGADVTEELLSKRSLLDKFKDTGIQIANIPRALMSSFDLSAPFRQGVFFVSRPRQFFPAFRDMFKAYGSENAYKAIEENIRARPTFDLMHDSGLAITDMEALASREEAFATSIAERMPEAKGSGPIATVARGAAKGYNATMGRGVRASGRAYTAFLTKLRADVFDDLVTKATAQGLKPEEGGKIAKDIARLVNAGTGRGDLPQFMKGAAPVLNAVFFSPRLMVSRLQLMNPLFYAGLEPFARKEALKSAAGFLGFGASLLGLANLAGADVGTNPYSSDFGKIKVGDTRLDVWGGFQQYARMMAQLAGNKYVSATSGKEVELGEGYKPLTRYDILMRQVESKEAPIFSFITNMLRQQEYNGQPVSVMKEIAERVTPMFISDMIELAVEDPEMLPLGALGGLGFGVQTFKPKEGSSGKAGTGNPYGGSSSKNPYGPTSDNFGHDAAVQELSKRVPPGSSPAVAAQTVASAVPVYEAPDGTRIQIPAGIRGAFANNYTTRADPLDTPIKKWLTAMQKQGKVKKGGRLLFEEAQGA